MIGRVVEVADISLADGRSRSNRNNAVLFVQRQGSLADGRSRSNRNICADNDRPRSSLADGRSRSNRNVRN